MKRHISEAIKAALTTLGAPGLPFTVERPADMSHGDFASNAALVAAKPLGQSPRQVAEALQNIISASLAEVAEVAVAGPGFLNFTVTRTQLPSLIEDILRLNNTWGTGTAWKEKRVVVEYTDPNPFKEFHVGHLFTNAVGESIARLFIVNGADVRRVNYQGDVGLHVAHAIYGMQQLGLTADGNFNARDMGRAYALGATTYREDETVAAAIRTINNRIYDRTDGDINALYDAGRKVSLEYFESLYQILGTKFDEYFFESETGPRGKALVLQHPEIFPESDGARIFRGEEHGLHTRVFLNHEGLPTYEAKELALAKVKAERLGEYDHSVISTSHEINEYFKVLLCAMGFVYPELAAKTEHIGHGMVRLPTGKMSSRTGQVIAALDFINDVATAAEEKMVAVGATNPTPELSRAIAIGAIKYATLKGNVRQDSIFDPERALSFEGDSGPYLQYTHARIGSVLEKAAGLGITPDTSTPPPTPYEVERVLLHFPHVIESALADRAPHQVVTYLTELAGTFNAFYAHERIADGTDPYAPYKAAVAAAVRATLKNGLWVLAIPAPERM
jgi:arginyl-tRNA synthetase